MIALPHSEGAGRQWHLKTHRYNLSAVFSTRHVLVTVGSLSPPFSLENTLMCVVCSLGGTHVVGANVRASKPLDTAPHSPHPLQGMLVRHVCHCRGSLPDGFLEIGLCSTVPADRANRSFGARLVHGRRPRSAGKTRRSMAQKYSAFLCCVYVVCCCSKYPVRIIHAGCVSGPLSGCVGCALTFFAGNGTPFVARGPATFLFFTVFTHLSRRNNVTRSRT